jgi:hypothetical protein
MMDGLYDCWPLSTMDGYFETRMAVPCYLSISVSADSGSTPDEGMLSISLATDLGLDTDAVINAMLTESGIPGTGTYAAQGMDYNYGLRENLFSPAGTTVSFGPAPETLELDTPYAIPPEWDWEQLYLTVFVQNPVSDEVLNSCMLKMSDLLGTGIPESPGSDAPMLTIGPNPSTGAICYRADGFDSPVSVTIFSIDGRLIGSSTLSEGTFIIRTPGVYTIRAESPSGESASRQAVVIP